MFGSRKREAKISLNAIQIENSFLPEGRAISGGLLINNGIEAHFVPTIFKFLWPPARDFGGARGSGLLFRSRTGKQLRQSNILRRGLHPILKQLKWRDAELGLTKAGSHAFRRFRDTYLRNYTSTPPGVLQFWLGHAGQGMSDLYDKVRRDVAFRKEVAEKAGLGFELPSKITVIGRNGRKWTEMPDVQVAVNA